MAKRTMSQRLFPGEPFHFGSFQAAVARRAEQARAVLDLGCGENRFLAPLRSPEREVWGTDFNKHPHLQDEAWFRPLGPGAKVPFPDSSFDLVTAVWVLEHIEDPGAFLDEVGRVLRPGGSFLAHSINGRHYVTGISRLLGRLPHGMSQWLVRRLYGRPAHDTFPTFYRLNTPAAMERAARSAGLTVADYRCYADAGYFRFNRVAMGAAVCVDYALEQVRRCWGRVYFSVELEKPLRLLTGAAA